MCRNVSRDLRAEPHPRHRQTTTQPQLGVGAGRVYYLLVFLGIGFLGPPRSKILFEAGYSVDTHCMYCTCPREWNNGLDRKKASLEIATKKERGKRQKSQKSYLSCFIVVLCAVLDLAIFTEVYLSNCNNSTNT